MALGGRCPVILWETAFLWADGCRYPIVSGSGRRAIYEALDQFMEDNPQIGTLAAHPGSVAKPDAHGLNTGMARSLGMWFEGECMTRNDRRPCPGRNDGNELIDDLRRRRMDA